MKLMPVLMYKAWQNGDVEEMKKNNIMDCIECGSCAYTCPASVPLVLGGKAGHPQRVRTGEEIRRWKSDGTDEILL